MKKVLTYFLGPLIFAASCNTPELKPDAPENFLKKGLKEAVKNDTTNVASQFSEMMDTAKIVIIKKEDSHITWDEYYVGGALLAPTTKDTIGRFVYSRTELTSLMHKDGYTSKVKESAFLYDAKNEIGSIDFTQAVTFNANKPLTFLHNHKTTPANADYIPLQGYSNFTQY